MKVCVLADSVRRAGLVTLVRASIAAVPTLGAGVTIPPPVALAHGVMITPELGFFDLPAIGDEFLNSPKGARNEPVAWSAGYLSAPSPSTPAGFRLSRATGTRLLIDPQRSRLAAEFMQAMTEDVAEHANFGVLLTGPAGAGKSSVGLLCFLYCVARGLLCVYIPNAREWVGEAQAGRGDEFFLKVLLRQNADLILANPALRAVFDSAFAGGPLDADVMARLLDALVGRPGPTVGCIVDEVQWITQAMADAVPGCSIEDRRAAHYFAQWQNWDNRHSSFVRMDIASAHGSRELKLGGGDEERLRFVRPWPAAEFGLMCSTPASPLYIANPAQRARAYVISGGILRLCYKITRDLAGAVPLADVERDIRDLQLECCQRWFETLEAGEKKSATMAMLALVRGEVRWNRVKGLYDDGIVARFTSSTFVEPVSPIAASVLFEVLSLHGRVCAPLSSFDDGAARGMELERQVLVCLCLSGRRALSATSLNGGACRSVVAFADLALPLTTIAEDLRMSNLPVLFIPLSPQFACDAITLPALGSDAVAPIVLWECSVTDPREPGRVNKVFKWFDEGGIISELRAVLPNRPVVCAFCWNDELSADSKKIAYKKLDAAAFAACIAPRSPVTCCLLGAGSLRLLGVNAT